MIESDSLFHLFFHPYIIHLSFSLCPLCLRGSINVLSINRVLPTVAAIATVVGPSIVRTGVSVPSVTKAMY